MLLMKGWQIASDSLVILCYLSRQCNSAHSHKRVEGRDTKQSGLYPERFALAIHKAIKEIKKRGAVQRPSCDLDDRLHRENIDLGAISQFPPRSRMNRINATFIKTDCILLWSARCGDKWLLRREPLSKYIHMDPIMFET